MRIDEALAAMDVPVVEPPYMGASDTYVTFQLVLDSDQLWAEGDGSEGAILWAVDLFTRGEWLAGAQQIKRLLTGNGFVVSGVGPQMYENDTKYTHIPISCYEVK